VRPYEGYQLNPAVSKKRSHWSNLTGWLVSNILRHCPGSVRPITIKKAIWKLVRHEKSSHRLANAFVRASIPGDERSGQATTQFYPARTKGPGRVSARNFGLKISVKEIK
jgi:hypothetical protein